MVDVSICGAGAALKVGYMNESGGATPLCHVGTFLGACSDCHCFLLISLCIRPMHATDGTAGMARGSLS